MSSSTGKLGGYRTGQMQQFTPEQMQLFQSLFSHVSPNSYLSKLAQGDEATFGQIEKPALQQFGALQGNLASRFSGAGARHSSGFQNTMNQASSDFAGQLQSQRQGLQRQALMDLLGISESLLGQRPYENFLMPKKQGFLEQVLGVLGSGFGQAAGTNLGSRFF